LKEPQIEMTGSADLLLTRLRQLRDQYQRAHRNGMEALERRDLDALDMAVREERRILDEQTTLIADLRRVTLTDRLGNSPAATGDAGESGPGRS
jgi:hypothetical protein